jgi:hypothetical protein
VNAFFSQLTVRITCRATMSLRPFLWRIFLVRRRRWVATLAAILMSLLGSFSTLMLKPYPPNPKTIGPVFLLGSESNAPVFSLLPLYLSTTGQRLAWLAPPQLSGAAAVEARCGSWWCVTSRGGVIVSVRFRCVGQSLSRCLPSYLFCGCNVLAVAVALLSLLPLCC